MNSVLVLGAGKIGSLIASLLSESKDYQVHLADLTLDHCQKLIKELNLSYVVPCAFDVRDRQSLKSYLTQHKMTAVISSLPYYCNVDVAEVAHELNVNYFDLTEDVSVTEHIKQLSKHSKSSLVPQCGLAPGFISIAANELMTHFDSIDTVKMRVGALPVHPSNALKYSLTWSTDGLINEYGNTCYGIDHGQKISLQPLEGYETIEVDGLLYEAFNTSGGLGTLADTYAGKVKTMNYKTLRYPGHCEKIQLLMNDLKLNDDRDTLKRILENAIPQTQQDVVLIYVSVSGKQKGGLFEESYVKKVYPQKIAGRLWSAIQITTASSICSVVDLVLKEPAKYLGFVTQESFTLEAVQNNRFGQYYR